MFQTKLIFSPSVLPLTKCFSCQIQLGNFFNHFVSIWSALAGCYLYGTSVSQYDVNLNLLHRNNHCNWLYLSLLSILQFVMALPLSTGHTQFAIFVMSLYLFKSEIVFFRRCLNIYRQKSVWWKCVLVAPFHQLFSLSVLSWRSKMMFVSKDDERSQISKHVKIEIDE